jgi:hypothetical protein
MNTVVDMCAGALQEQFRGHSEYFGLVQGMGFACKQERTTLKSLPELSIIDTISESQ